MPIVIFIPAAGAPPEPAVAFELVIDIYDQYDGQNFGNYTGSNGQITPDPVLYPGMPGAAGSGAAAEDAEIGDWYVDYLTLSVTGTIRSTLTCSGGVDDEYLPYSSFNGSYVYISESIVNNFVGEPEPYDTRTITRTYRKYVA